MARRPAGVPGGGARPGQPGARRGAGPRGAAGCASACSGCSPTRRARSTCCCCCAWPPSWPRPASSRRTASDRVPGSWAVALAVAVMVVVSYVLRRRRAAHHRPPAGRARRAGRRAARRSVLTRVFGPVPRLLILLGNALTPGKGFREGPFASEAELRDLVDLAQERGVVEEAERDMIDNVFDLGDTIAREVMVPRTDMVFIEHDKTVRQALNLALRSGFSRIPVVGEAPTTSRRRLPQGPGAAASGGEGGADRPVEEVMRPPVFVPESKPVDDLLREMQASLGHLAIVVDEYGGTAGLVTMEDVARGDRRRDRRRVRPRAPARRAARPGHLPGHRPAARRGPRGAVRRRAAARGRRDGRGAARQRARPGADPGRHATVDGITLVGGDRRGPTQPDHDGAGAPPAPTDGARRSADRRDLTPRTPRS